MINDKSLRKLAIPFKGQVMGYNRGETSDQDVSVAVSLGDLFGLVTSPAKDNMIRILRPRYGIMVSAYLTIVIQTSSLETSPQFKITVGTGFTDSGINPSTPTDDQISDIHKRITGSESYFSNTAGLPIAVEKVNIRGFIPEDGYRDWETS